MINKNIIPHHTRNKTVKYFVIMREIQYNCYMKQVYAVVGLQVHSRFFAFFLVDFLKRISIYGSYYSILAKPEK
jgi:hypothetical protein